MHKKGDIVEILIDDETEMFGTIHDYRDTPDGRKYDVYFLTTKFENLSENQIAS